MFSFAKMLRLVSLLVVVVVALAQQETLGELDTKALLQNPAFLAFFQEFQNHYNKIKQENKEGVTEAAIAQTPEPKVTRRPVVIQPPIGFHPGQELRTLVNTVRPNGGFMQEPERLQPTPQQGRRRIKPHRKQGNRKANNFDNFVARFKPAVTSPPIPQSQTTEAVPVFSRIKATEVQTTEAVPILSRVKATAAGKDLSKFDEAVFRKQAESAKYEFASETDDSITGNFHQRQEVRDGLKVKGQYSYNDGFYKRTVHYEADDKGYRVVKEDVEAIGDGPQFNPHGSARVSQFVAGNAVNYEITDEDIQKRPAAELVEEE